VEKLSIGFVKFLTYFVGKVLAYGALFLEIIDKCPRCTLSPTMQNNFLNGQGLGGA
jgi:hypothetical protein